MSALAPLLIWAGKNFGAGFLNIAGSVVASAVVPIVVPKIACYFRNRRSQAADESECDPDLC